LPLPKLEINRCAINCVDVACAFSGRVPFAFLEDIHGRFVKAYGRTALTALAYAMNDEFSRVLAQQMDYYSNDASADRITRMRGEIDQVYTIFLLRHDVIIIVIRKKNETKLSFNFGSLTTSVLPMQIVSSLAA